MPHNSRIACHHQYTVHILRNILRKHIGVAATYTFVRYSIEHTLFLINPYTNEYCHRINFSHGRTQAKHTILPAAAMISHINTVVCHPNLSAIAAIPYVDIELPI